MPPVFSVTAVSPGAILELPHLQQPVKEVDSSIICPGCDSRGNQMSSGFGAPCPGGELGASKPWTSTAPCACPMMPLPYRVSPKLSATNCLNKQLNLSCTILPIFFPFQSLYNFPLAEAHIPSAVCKFSFIICHFPLG